MKDPRIKDFVSLHVKVKIDTVGDYSPGNKSFLESFPNLKEYYKAKRKENATHRK